MEFLHFKPKLYHDEYTKIRFIRNRRLEIQTQFTEKFINRKKWEKPDPGAVITYIPGSIIDLYVKEGQEVKAGDLLCLLEAMKMHNKIQAPISGTVIKIHVNKGDKLPKDALMFEIK